MHRAIKMKYPRGSTDRETFLAGGRVVIVLDGMPIDRSNEESYLHAVWHISNMRFSPFEPVYQPMELERELLDKELLLRVPSLSATVE